jgi:hypothetical protein
MPDDIAQLTELMESYRDRSRAIRFRPVSAAYADAANELEEIIAALELDVSKASSDTYDARMIVA